MGLSPNILGVCQMSFRQLDNTSCSAHTRVWTLRSVVEDDVQHGFDVVQKWRPQLRTLETETINMAKKHKKAAKRDTPSSRRANDAVARVHEDAPGDKLSSKQYLKELAKLQIDLIKMQDWIVQKKLKVLVIFEGRDAAGKGGGNQANHGEP